MANKLIDTNTLLYFKTKLLGLISNNYVAKEDGKGLSTNDYTTDEKTKLSNIDAGANKTVVEDVLTSTSKVNALSANQGKVLSEKIKSVEDSMAEAGNGDMLKSVYDADNNGIVDNAEKVNGHTVKSDVPENAVFTDTTYENANATKAGLMSSGHYTKVEGIESGAEKNVITAVKKNGTALTVTNKAVDITVPTTVAELTDASDYAKASAIPTVSNKTLTIQRNGTTVKSFTANSASDVTCNIEVPTTVAQLSDAGDYALKTDIANAYIYRGSVANKAALPTGATAGDVYNVEDTGMNWAWNGAEWDNLGAIYSFDFAENTDIDEMFT